MYNIYYHQLKDQRTPVTVGRFHTCIVQKSLKRNYSFYYLTIVVIVDMVTDSLERTPEGEPRNQQNTYRDNNSAVRVRNFYV